MEYIPKDKILEHNAGVLQAVRGKYGLDGPGRMAEAVNILKEWIQKQTHFRKKDFNPRYLETTLITRKGSIERAKVLLDKYCTMRTLLPQFFGRVDVSSDVGNLREFLHRVFLPRPTKDNYRVYILKMMKDNLKPADMMNFYKFSVVLAEYMKANDYSNGFIVVADLSEVNIMDLVTNIDIVDAKQIADIQMEAFGARVSNFYVVSDSKVVNLIINILKQVLNPKVAGRIEVMKNISELQNVIDKRILPKDYGGEERSIRELSDLWIDALSSEEHLQFLEEMSDANTDESFRPHDKFNEQYAGMAGTFRALRVD